MVSTRATTQYFKKEVEKLKLEVSKQQKRMNVLKDEKKKFEQKLSENKQFIKINMVPL